MASFFPIQKAVFHLSENLKNCSGVLSVNIMKNPVDQQPYLLVKVKSNIWQSAVPTYYAGHKILKEIHLENTENTKKSPKNLNHLLNYQNFLNEGFERYDQSCNWSMETGKKLHDIQDMQEVKEDIAYFEV